jgi:thymidylate synthase (FAD)
MSHLIVRHRIASYSQESTQFCNYSKERFGNDIFFILPVQYYPLFEETNDGIAFKQFLSESPLKNRALLWWGLCRLSEQTYFGMIEQGATPQEARSSLITSVKTELICSMNLRSWRHFFKLRTSKADQLQIQELAGSMLKEFKNILPSVFEDINIDE